MEDSEAIIDRSEVDLSPVLRVPLGHQDLPGPLVPQVHIYPEVELLGRRSIQAWEDRQVHNCSQEGRDHHHHHQGVPGLQEDPEVWLRPFQREEPDPVVAAGSGGFGLSPPFERASSGSGVVATERERDLI